MTCFYYTCGIVLIVYKGYNIFSYLDYFFNAIKKTANVSICFSCKCSPSLSWQPSNNDSGTSLLAKFDGKTGLMETLQIQKILLFLNGKQ